MTMRSCTALVISDSRVVVDHSRVGLVEARSQVLLSSCQADCVGNTLTQGACTDKQRFGSTREEIVHCQGGGAPLTWVLLDILKCCTASVQCVSAWVFLACSFNVRAKSVAKALLQQLTAASTSAATLESRDGECTCCDLNSQGLEVLGVTRRLASPLPELLEVLQLQPREGSQDLRRSKLP